MHMHDTGGMAQQNCLEGLKLGITEFDSAVGGCGGCNFAPGAKGNLSTQKLLAVLDYYEMSHSVDKEKMASAHSFLETSLKRDLDPVAEFSLP
mmetsp:Transcript_12671/g.23976  ORF Transcript_12671/g.23976 Transcript_12671/m.23976 type:complete len:93 (+) Transcript_12671:2-280(+)